MYYKLNTRLVYLAVLAFFYTGNLYSQQNPDSISREYIEKTITYLASDKLKGRVNYTKEQLEAAEFLAGEFKNFGLDPFPGSNGFYIPFQTRMGQQSRGKLEWNGRKINDSLYFYLPSHLAAETAKIDDFIILRAEYPLADSIIYYNWLNKASKTLIWVSSPDSIPFSETIKNLVIPNGLPASDILIVFDREEPRDLKIKFKENESLLYNIVGMIPGDSLPSEAIIFSAHYDHIDIGIEGQRGEIFNGANDDASGTTAVLALAKYFSMRKNNKRTLIFCLFSGEELGMYGSTAFVKLVKPENIMAVINIEMIGTHNMSGKNAFMVNGTGYSNLPDLLKKNMKGEKFSVRLLNSDPQRLFQRSDNYPFALEGIPAHTIMCSDDDDPCYHRPCDDVDRIDMNNMSRVIRAIAKSAQPLIDGIQTPTRIKK